MKRNMIFKLLMVLSPVLGVSNSYAQDRQSLSCDQNAVPAYVISFDLVFTKLIDDQPDMKGRRTVIATTATNYLEETGERLDALARRRGEIQYNLYQKERWETSEAIYTLQDEIARVRLNAADERSFIPYKLADEKSPVRTIAGYKCHWSEENIAGVQKTQRCSSVFYGWTIPLYTRKIAEGRDVLFSEATEIIQRCIKKDSLYVPQDRPWKFTK